MAMGIDLDNLEYASDFWHPTDHSSGDDVCMMQGVIVGPGPV